MLDITVVCGKKVLVQTERQRVITMMAPGFCRMRKLAVVVVMAGLAGSSAMAGSITFSNSAVVQNGGVSEHLSALVTFTNIGNSELGVTLANVYTGDTPDQSSVLTGFFFNYSNPGGLTPVSAMASPGSHQWQAATESDAPDPSVLGQEWAYGTGSAPGGANAGIVSAGLYTPGSGNFAGPGDMLDGSSYGIVSAGYAGSDMDGLDGRPYVQSSIFFVLSGFNGDLGSISDVTFQYGTTQSEPSMPGIPVPEPGLVSLAGLGGLALLIRRGLAKPA